MASSAMDSGDKAMAIVSWAGVVAFGPVVPGVLLVVNWRKRESLARRHALMATTMWVAALTIWIPIVVTQLVMPIMDNSGPSPRLWVWMVGGGLAICTLTCSVLGIVNAAQASVQDQPPTGI